MPVLIGQWVCIALLLLAALPVARALRCHCTDEDCINGVCEGNACLIGQLKSTHSVIRTCGDGPIGCQRDVGKWADLCVCELPRCNTFSFFRTSTRRERGYGPGAGLDADPISGRQPSEESDDDRQLVFHRLDHPVHDERFSGYDRHQTGFLNTTANTNTFVFVLVPFLVGCAIVIIVWINYYRNLC